jgi:hypothetical protein
MKHYEELVDIQKEAERFYWEMNSFEPFWLIVELT